ncbi:MAG TPA: divalent cation tolerance protein CutA, partial [Oculatellaceae cyanobacterium]
MPLDACVVLVTCGTKEEAEHIARTTVEEALAACVNVLGGGGLLRSFYIWEEKLQQDEEWLLIMKT